MQACGNPKNYCQSSYYSQLASDSSINRATEFIDAMNGTTSVSGTGWVIERSFDGLIQLFFLMMVYGYVLLFASKMIADGSEMLMLILNPGIIGGLVLPVMGALPDGAMVLFSGLGDNAQESLSVGVGTLAGSTVTLLTIPWMMCTFQGAVDIDENGKPAYNKKPKLTKPLLANLGGNKYIYFFKFPSTIYIPISELFDLNL